MRAASIHTCDSDAVLQGGVSCVGGPHRRRAALPLPAWRTSDPSRRGDNSRLAEEAARGSEQRREDSRLVRQHARNHSGPFMSYSNEDR